MGERLNSVLSYAHVGKLKSTLTAFQTLEEWGIYIVEIHIQAYKYIQNSSLNTLMLYFPSHFHYVFVPGYLYEKWTDNKGSLMYNVHLCQ